MVHLCSHRAPLSQKEGKTIPNLRTILAFVDLFIHCVDKFSKLDSVTNTKEVFM